MPQSASIVVAKVPMGGIDCRAAPEQLETLLGSCVGVVMWCPRLKRAAMAHIVLADSHRQAFNETSLIGKFADTAVPELRRLMLEYGAAPTRLIAKIAGGSNMFAQQKCGDVGAGNIAAVKAELSRLQIPVAAEDVGGNVGRVVRFDPANGRFEIWKAGILVNVL